MTCIVELNVCLGGYWLVLTIPSKE